MRQREAKGGVSRNPRMTLTCSAEALCVGVLCCRVSRTMERFLFGHMMHPSVSAGRPPWHPLDAPTLPNTSTVKSAPFLLLSTVASNIIERDCSTKLHTVRKKNGMTFSDANPCELCSQKREKAFGRCNQTRPLQPKPICESCSAAGRVHILYLPFTTRARCLLDSDLGLPSDEHDETSVRRFSPCNYAGLPSHNRRSSPARQSRQP